MKQSLLRPFTAALAASVTLPNVVHAHPGHSAFDWFSAAPHTGHENEYVILLAALGLTFTIMGACWLASRKR